MRNMISKDFENLAQRSIYYFIATYPPFYSVNSAEASVEEQKEAHAFIKGIYEKLYRQPDLLGLKPLPDDSYGDWDLQKTNPGLVNRIRGNIKKIDAFICLIFNICLKGCVIDGKMLFNQTDLPLKPSNIKQLASFQIQTNIFDNQYSILFPISAAGLKLLAKISMENKQKPHLLFMHGVFNPEVSWTVEIFKNMFEDQDAYSELIQFLTDNGYQKVDNKQNHISLDYIKCYGATDDELKWAWAERTHGGIEIIYDEVRKNQPLIGLRVPYFSKLLKQSDQMSAQVKSFIISTSKKCDGCRYCVQTDKSGKRPLIYEKVDAYNICPLFCGFQYRWKFINKELVSNIIAMLEFIDDILKKAD